MTSQSQYGRDWNSLKAVHELPVQDWTEGLYSPPLVYRPSPDPHRHSHPALSSISRDRRQREA